MSGISEVRWSRCVLCDEEWLAVDVCCISGLCIACRQELQAREPEPEPEWDVATLRERAVARRRAEFRAAAAEARRIREHIAEHGLAATLRAAHMRPWDTLAPGGRGGAEDGRPRDV